VDWERARLQDRAEQAARLLSLTERTSLQRELAALDEEEAALINLRRTFGDDLLPVARGWKPGGRLSGATERGPLIVLAVPVPSGTGTAGVAVFEADLDWLRVDLLPAALTDLPLPEGVYATVLDDAGRPVVAGVAPGDRPVLAESRFGGALPFWRSVVYLGDTGVIERRTVATRRSHYAVMAAAIAGMLAAGWFVVRTVRRELRVAQLKSDFLSTVTHELKTPLTSIRMFVETLSEGRFQDEEERKEYLGVISRETERLSELIQRVLDLARLEGKGEDVLKRDPTDVSALLRETADLFRLRMDDDRTELRVEVEDGLGTHAIDPAATREVVLNLLSNALKYGGRHILLRARARDGGVTIAVEDDGIGISESDQARVFEKFYRANDTLARDAEGSGLGLALVREIARAHGGRVTVRSRPGEGSVFAVTLPGSD
jgi:signal transduction histidine kinase